MKLILLFLTLFSFGLSKRFLRKVVDNEFITFSLFKFNEDEIFYFETDGFIIKENVNGVTLIINLLSNLNIDKIQNIAIDCQFKSTINNNDSLVISFFKKNFDSENLIGFSSECELKIKYSFDY